MNTATISPSLATLMKATACRSIKSGHCVRLDDTGQLFHFASAESADAFRAKADARGRPHSTVTS
jgi:hypothetical protein